jgi:hypothetical protein
LKEMENPPRSVDASAFSDTLTETVLFAKSVEHRWILDKCKEEKWCILKEVIVCDKETDFKRHAAHGTSSPGESSRGFKKLG